MTSGFFYGWSVPYDRIGLSKEYQEVTILVVESLWGKKRIFAPGRRCAPLEVRECNKHIVAYAIRALTAAGWEFDPQKIVGTSVLTEGAGVPFFEAFDLVWSDQRFGGVLNTWARREMVNAGGNSGTYAEFNARMTGLDTTLEKHPIPGAIGIFFDIGATGATLGEVVPTITDWFEYLIFASPCTSAVAARKFVEAAVAGGMNPRRLAIVANEGFFGLHGNGTFLSFQLPGTVTSRGNIALSRAVYPHPSFCHIGAGGLAANWPGLYEEELFQDEEDFRCQLRRFESLGEAMNHAEVRWPDDFGSKLSSS